MAPIKKGNLSKNEEKLTELINAGKTEEVKALITEDDVHIDCLDEQGMTPLMHASYRGNDQLVRLFLAHGADVNANEHEHGYSALIFGALSGKTETVRLLLQAGARTGHTNSVGRTASQMAGFVGQHQVVSVINNFLPRRELDYYTVPKGLETEPKLPPHLSSTLFGILNQSNLNPVRISMQLQKQEMVLGDTYKVCKVLELILEKNMKAHDTNEVMAMKLHYLATLIRHADKSMKDNNNKLDVWIKSLLRGREADGFPEAQEKMIRSMLKSFPYIESQLLQQMVRSIASVPIGGDPTALSILNQGINGQRFGSEDDNQCGTCDEFYAEKKCSACKMVNYCNQECQKLHWFMHKKFCKALAVKYAEIQEHKRLVEEQKKREEEEKARLEAEKAKEEAEKTTEETENGQGVEKKTEEGGENGVKDVGGDGDKSDETSEVTDKLKEISTESDPQSLKGTETPERSVSMSDVKIEDK